MVLTLAGNVVSGMIMSVIQVGKIAAGPVPIKLFILYLKICLATSIFITFFMLGGFITPLLGIIYIYDVFFKRLKCWSKNISQDKCDIY